MSFVNLDNYQKDYNYIYIYSFTLNRVFKFPAFLTGLTDSRRCNWSINEIYGRMDPIYTYKNTVRKISISFDVVAENIQKAEQYQNDLQIGLRQSIYPIYRERPVTSYESKNGKATYKILKAQPGKEEYALSSPPFHRIRFCNLIKSKDPFTHTDGNSNVLKDGLLGWIDGFTFSPKMDSGVFKYKNFIYAKLFNISLNLNVLHEHFLGYRITQDGNNVNRSDRIEVTEEKVAQEISDSSISLPSTPVEEVMA